MKRFRLESLPPKGWGNLGKALFRVLFAKGYLGSALDEIRSRTASVELTIVSVNWNGDPFIRKCVREVSRLTNRSFLHIVWDNKSRDGSRLWLRDCPHAILTVLGGTNTKHDAPLQVLSRVIRSRYMVVLDSDAWPIKAGWEDRLLGALAPREILVAGAGSSPPALPHPVVHPWLMACRTDWGRKRNWLKSGAGYGWDTAQALSLVAGKEGIHIFDSEALVDGDRFTKGVKIPNIAFHQFAGSQFHKGRGKLSVNGVPRDVWERTQEALWTELEGTEDSRREPCP